MNGDETPYWRIDALDARAGMAFACYRGAESTADVEVDPDLPAVFIGPPTYRPEYLTSRALGLAAARGSFQERLFSGGGEVGFNELAELIDYVRRSMVSGSSGDGGGAGSSQVPPPPPEAPAPEIDLEFPDVPPEGGAIQSIGGLFAKFAEASQQLTRTRDGGNPPVGATEFEWRLSLYAGEVGGRRFNVFEAGGIRVMQELLYRLGGWRNDGERYQWTEAASRFGYCCAELDLWRHWYGRNGWFPKLLNLIPAPIEFGQHPHPRVREMFNRGKTGHDQSAYQFLWALFLFEEDFYFTEWEYFNYYPWPATLGNSYQSDAPMQDMSYWPIPANLRKLANPNNPERASVKDLLAGLASRPTEFVSRGRGTLHSALEIGLFAVAHLTHRDPALPPLMMEDEPYKSQKQGMGRGRRGSRFRKAWRWLSEQLPSRVFEPMIEEMIASTATRDYRDERNEYATR